MGGNTPTDTSSNEAGSMSTWQDYSGVLERQRQMDNLSQGVTKGVQQFGAGISEGSKSQGGSESSPQVSMSPIQQGAQGAVAIPQIARPNQPIDLVSALTRILGLR